MAQKLRQISLLLLSLLLLSGSAKALIPPPGPQSDSTGVEGTITGPAPNQAPSIGIPSNGQTFTTSLIRVSGLCQSGLLVEIFKNQVFSGSQQCTSGSYDMQVDLFNGRNDLLARQYDALNQSSPDSNTVSVTLNTSFAGNAPQILITTQYAKRGANPGTVLSWPLSVSGGTPPYAVSVDWGDKTAFELLSLGKAGDFTISHTYTTAGTYNVTVKIADNNGNASFLQMVGVANGTVKQGAGSSSNQKVVVQHTVVYWPFYPMIALAIIAFWLGRKHQLDSIRSRIRKGERPF